MAGNDVLRFVTLLHNLSYGSTSKPNHDAKLRAPNPSADQDLMATSNHELCHHTTLLQAKIYLNRGYEYLGVYATKEEAAAAYDVAARLYGKRLNYRPPPKGKCPPLHHQF
jgi:hypothetical protein